MFEIYSALSILSLITIGYLSLPILRAQRVKSVTHSALKQNEEQIFIDKKTELDEDFKAQRLSKADYEKANDELTLELAVYLKNKPATQGNDIKLTPIWALPIVIVGLAVVIYFMQGKPAQLQTWQHANDSRSALGEKIVMGDGKDVTFEDLRTFYLGLRIKLYEKPDDAVGWLLLGRVAAAIGDHEAAIKGFEQSLILEPNKRSTMLSYAQALIGTQQEKHFHTAKKTLHALIKMDAKDVEAAMLLGYVENQLGNHELAHAILNDVITQLPLNDPRRELILQAMPTLAHNKTDNAKTESATANTDSPRIEVSLAGIDADVKSFKYLFVFARPAKKGPPFAVQKIALGQSLPEKVTLTDANAMMQGMNLSSVSQVYVSVRLSFDANVMLADGELEFHSELTDIAKNKTTSVQF
ncbi:c-type cytochrome biogenesis protein CcmI [Algibacillus agarilyticus]|uniref:c-type cytochrome biogenesis protein CcmI n=1 Tax=Algibacillus agarilyticus TaxID=2234133 RepID=UPI000DCFE540|nr:c-type cytochrome biogenesis protein CcmI [Algibacillus agarilyticus]